MKFKTIIRRTPKQRIADAQYVRILAEKTGHDKQGRAFYAAQTVSTHNRLPNGKLVRAHEKTKYVTVVSFRDSKLNVMVSCSCPDFTYRWEVALAKKKAATIEYSNGEDPIMTNPAMVPAACKHLVAVYNKIKSKIE